MTEPEFRISENPKEATAAYLADTLRDHIASGDQVLLLLPGGSAIEVATEAAAQLHPTLEVSFNKLIVSLGDERYGEVGHSDSNWQQLMQAGFAVEGAQLHPVLLGQDIATTARDFAAWLGEVLPVTQYKIALFGIGPDGHTGGILPGSPACESTAIVDEYNAGAYQRVTLTPMAMAMLSEVVVYAVGEAKHATLAALRERHAFLEQPAQALKEAGKLTIFTDQKI